MVLFDNTVSMETARFKSIRKYKNGRVQKRDRYIARFWALAIKNGPSLISQKRSIGRILA